MIAPHFGKMTIYPYFYQTKDGRLETSNFPISAHLTKYHIIFLYSDMISVVSRINSNVIKTCHQLYSVTFNSFNEYYNTLLITNGTEISLFTVGNEEKDVWRVFAQQNEYERATALCKQFDKQNITLVARLYAEQLFREGSYHKSAKKYSESNEKFEEVMMKFLMADQTNSLLYYLEKFQKNIEPKATNAQLWTLSTLRLEMMLKAVVTRKQVVEEKTNTEAFFNLFNELRSEGQLDKNTICELLLAYCRIPDYLMINQLTVVA